MKKELQSATSQFQENDALDFSKTEKLLNLHKDLYQKAKSEFFKTCPICYEISSYNSYCNCKIKCDTLCPGCEEISIIDTWIDCKDNGFNRTDLIQFMAIYENTEIKLKEDKLFFKNALDGCFNDDLIEQNNKKDLNKPAIITVQQFMKEQGYVSIHKTVRKNQDGLPYLTFIKVDNVAHNIYFSKEAGQDKQAGQLLYKGFFDKLNIAKTTNIYGEVKINIVDKAFDVNNEIQISKVEQIQETEKTAVKAQTVEQTEIKFIKELFLAILICGLILFLTITVIAGTFFENIFFRNVLTFFSSDKISIEDKIQDSGFAISAIVLILLFSLSHIGSKTKSKILKKNLNSKKSIQIYILMGLVLFAVVFWQVSAMLVIGFAVVFALLMIGVFINNRM